MPEVHIGCPDPPASRFIRIFIISSPVIGVVIGSDRDNPEGRNDGDERSHPLRRPISRRATLAAGLGAVGSLGIVGLHAASTNPIEIANWDDLAGIGNGTGTLDDDYVLVVDLNQSSPGYTGTGDDWDPIGDDGDRFTGTFDGYDHTISDLELDSSDGDQGLFGVIEGATIKSLSFENLDITGGTNTGGLVGQSRHHSLIEHVSVTGDVSRSGGSASTGGVLGRNFGTVREVTANVSVEGGNWVGGIVAEN